MKRLRTDSTVLTAQTTSHKTCPFCHGSGGIVVEEDELTVTWGRDVRERVLKELEDMEITQDLFACASLACRQSHLSRILRAAQEGDMKDRQVTELKQIDVFLRLPYRCRQDIYERVASDSRAFVRAARLHARLLHEDAGIPGLSQIARAVLDRFAAEVTLYPDPGEISVMAETLLIHSDLVRAYFDRLAEQLTSSPQCPETRVADFKVPSASQRPPLKERNAGPAALPKHGGVECSKPWPPPLPPAPPTIVVKATAPPSPIPTAAAAVVVGDEEAVAPVGKSAADGKAVASLGEPLPDDVWILPAMNSSPVKREEDAPGLETEDSFVRGLLASPPSGHGGSPLHAVSSVFEDRFPSTLDTPGPPDEDYDPEY